MSIEELEAEALRLDPKARAGMAARLLESLDDLSPEESARLWAEEAQRRAEAEVAGSLAARDRLRTCFATPGLGSETCSRRSMSWPKPN